MTYVLLYGIIDYMSTNTKKVKCVGYVRVSTLLRQRPEDQVTQIQEFCKARSLELGEIYVDRGIQGDRERRPQLDRMLKDAQAGKFQVIVCAAVDRIGRSTLHLLKLMEELRHFGVSIISIREQIDFSSPTGQMALTMISAVATLEKQILSERVRSSMAARKLAAEQSGTAFKCGRPLLATKEMQKEVLALRDKGLSIRQIERALEKKISRGTVQRILNASRK